MRILFVFSFIVTTLTSCVRLIKVYDRKDINNKEIMKVNKRLKAEILILTGFIV